MFFYAFFLLLPLNVIRLAYVTHFVQMAHTQRSDGKCLLTPPRPRVHTAWLGRDASHPSHSHDPRQTPARDQHLRLLAQQRLPPGRTGARQATARVENRGGGAVENPSRLTDWSSHLCRSLKSHLRCTLTNEIKFFFLFLFLYNVTFISSSNKHAREGTW